MNRRARINRIVGLMSALLLGAYGARASEIPRVGYLCFRSPQVSDDAFFEGMRALGWVEGKNVLFDRRFSSGNDELLKRSANDLVSLKVDVIVACASQSALAAQAATATTSIPVIFASAGDPVGQKLIATLSRPGGNITGTAFDASPEMITKQVQLLVRTVPKIARVAILWNSTRPFIRKYWEAAQKATAALGVSFQSVEASRADDFDSAFQAMSQQHADGVVVLSDALMTTNAARLAQLAARTRIPAMYGHNLYTMAGGLMSYGPSLPDLYRNAASYVDKVLRGSKPSDIPVQEPTKFEFIVNLKTAKTLGLAIPPDVMTTADRLIE